MHTVVDTLPLHLVLQLITTGNNSFNYSLHTTLSQRPTVLPDGYTAYPDIGVAMKYHANDLTWNLARKHCILEGGNLAVIDSLEKSHYANDLRKENPRGAMLGIHKLFDNVEWVSVKTGLPLEFIPWRSGADHGPTAPSCTALWGSLGGRVGPWNCSQSWSYICEVPVPEVYESEVQPSLIQAANSTFNESLTTN